MKPVELLKWRQKYELTQLNLATILGVTKTTVYRWEKGMRDIPPFLHLALRCLELEGGELKQRVKKTKKKRR